MALGEGEERNFSNSLAEQKDLGKKKIHILIAVGFEKNHFSPGATGRFIILSAQDLHFLLRSTPCYCYQSHHLPASHLGVNLKTTFTL